MPFLHEEQESSKLKKHSIKKVHNSFIENAITKSNVQALKVILYLANALDKVDYEKHLGKVVELTMSYEDVLSFTGINDSEFTKALKAMQKTSITFKNIEEQWEESVSLLPRIKRLYGKKEIEIDIYKSVAKLILDVPRELGGTMLNLQDIVKLNNKHSIRILPILHMINGFEAPAKKQKAYSIQSLNAIFGTNYNTFKDLIRNVLEPLREELNQGSKMTFDYDTEMGYTSPLKKGRPKILSVVIYPKSRNQYQGTLII